MCCLFYWMKQKNGASLLNCEDRKDNQQGMKVLFSEESGFPALAAQTSDEEEEQIAAIDSDGNQVGVLSFDYGKAALILYITGSLPFREAFGIEVETQEGEILTSQFLPTQERRLVLQEKTELRESDIRRITLKLQTAVGL